MTIYIACVFKKLSEANPDGRPQVQNVERNGKHASPFDMRCKPCPEVIEGSGRTDAYYEFNSTPRSKYAGEMLKMLQEVGA